MDSHQGKGKEETKLMAILSYIGPLVVVSYLAAKDDPFVKFHIKQGAVLFAIEFGFWIAGIIVWPLMMLWGLVDICALVLSVIGIMNVVNQKEKSLPFVGQYSRYFTF